MANNIIDALFGTEEEFISYLDEIERDAAMVADFEAQEEFHVEPIDY